MKIWKNIPFSGFLSEELPTKAGLYAILMQERVLGLPVKSEVLYVGKSLNLRRRFLEHLNPWREHSRYLNPLKNYGNWEFWFLTMRQELLDKEEKTLIHGSKPVANIVHNKTKGRK